MNLRLLALTALLFSLTSCFDVYETFNLNSDGSGSYVQKMDFTRAMSFANMMKASGKEEGKTPQKIDSTISLRSFTDTAANLTSEERAVLGNGSMFIHLDETTGDMYFEISYPFANSNEFELIQQSFAKRNSDGMAMSALGGLLGQPAGNGQGTDKTPQLPAANFTYKLTGSSLVKTVKPGTAKDTTKTSSDDMPAEFKEMMKMSFTTIVNLPREVKKWSGNNGTLSADKKQLKFNKSVTMETTLTPEDFNFSIDY
ncbi:MAG TPA: hypothetical protein VF145_07925 [Chitinophagaceae bacterium]